MSKNANNRAVGSDTPVPEGPYTLVAAYDGNTNAIAGWHVVDTREQETNGVPKQSDYYYVRDEAIGQIITRMKQASGLDNAPEERGEPVQRSLF